MTHFGMNIIGMSSEGLIRPVKWTWRAGKSGPDCGTRSDYFIELAHPAGALQIRVFPYNPAPPGDPLFPTFYTNPMVVKLQVTSYK